MEKKRKVAPKVLYLLDTNILFDLAKGFVPSELLAEQDINRAGSSHNFIKTHQNIFIPDLVWVEFLSAFLHKDIDVSVDPAQTQRWLRDRQSVVQQVLALVRERPGMQFYSAARIDNLFSTAQTLLMNMPLCDETCFNFLHGSARNAFEKGWIKSMSAKMLDGMDSVILVYLHSLAKAHPDTTVKLRTNDQPLRYFFPAIKTHHQWFARNARVQIVQYKPAPAKPL